MGRIHRGDSVCTSPCAPADDRCVCESSWVGGGAGKVCVYTRTLVYICILEHLCVLVFLTSSSVSNLCVCMWVGGGRGPTGDGDGPPLP